MTYRQKFLVLIIGVLALGVGVWAIYWLEFMPWYSITIEPSEGRTLVRFAQPRMMLISPDFFIKGAAPAPGTYEIDPAGSKIPGCIFEFSDHAPLGGRHKIRIGSVLFDVSRRRRQGL